MKSNLKNFPNPHVAPNLCQEWKENLEKELHEIYDAIFELKYHDYSARGIIKELLGE